MHVVFAVHQLPLSGAWAADMPTDGCRNPAAAAAAAAAVQKAMLATLAVVDVLPGQASSAVSLQHPPVFKLLEHGVHCVCLASPVQ
jgi:hypothetical protein